MGVIIMIDISALNDRCEVDNEFECFVMIDNYRPSEHSDSHEMFDRYDEFNDEDSLHAG